MASPAIPATQQTDTNLATPPHHLADLYTFRWTEFSGRLPWVSAAAVAICLVTGLALGHPGGALIASGGAFTIGFGPNQRIADSRIRPMLLAIAAMASATLVGTLVGHRGFTLVLAAAASAAVYGVLTIRDSGLAWVAQQASVALFVASAYPSALRPALVRTGLIIAGGVLQVLATGISLHLLPDLRDNLVAIPRSLSSAIRSRRHHLLRQLYALPEAIPAPDRTTALIYATRLMLTVGVASEVYRYLGLQSGYWVPMTALLVQKPAFFETLERALARVLGTLAGAIFATLIANHLHPGPWTLAALVTLFAFGCYAVNGVNYGLFTLCITSYIVFLLSLNRLPGPEIAQRRAWCTMAGAAIALLIHLDALRRHRAKVAST